VLVAAAAAGGVAVFGSSARKSIVSACTTAASAGSAPFRLTPEQGQNASIIAAVALKMGLPDHAVTVALATALQESGLRNLPYGDSDSVGLFQQRPSQGWGTRVQILDQVYATTAFYQRLAQVPGWQTMAVTQAAQTVQQSAAPSAYAYWEEEARAWAVSLTGEVPAGLTCRLAAFTGPAPDPSAVSTAASSEMGSGVLTGALGSKEGWQVASWVVAHAWEYHIQRVGFGSWVWTLAAGRWSESSPSSGGSGFVTYR
jgi:hypothetical protein